MGIAKFRVVLLLAHLALLLHVCVVAAEGEAVAGEGGVLHGGEDGVVQAGLAGDGVAQPVQRVVTLRLHTQRHPRTQAWHQETLVHNCFCPFSFIIGIFI